MKNLQFVFLSTIMGILIGALGYFMLIDREHGVNIGEDINDTKISTKDCNNTTISKFDYTPVLPEDGKIKAVVIIGAAGFDGFIIKIDKDKNWESKKAYWGKESNIWDGNASSEEIMKGFRSFLGTIAKDGKEFGSKNLDRRVQLIVSSGASKVNTTTSKIIKALTKNKWIPTKISAEKEAEYGFIASVPEEHRNDSFFVDIGSGNTKIAWMENDKFNTAEGPGAKAYKIPKTKEGVYEDIKNLLENVPDDLRERAFMLGGVPYKLAKKVKNDDKFYTTLLQPCQYETQDFKEKSREKMEYGLKIYEAIQDATGTEQYIFPWHSNFGIGFLINQKY